MTAMSKGHGAFIPHFRLTADIGNNWDGKIGGTKALLPIVDEIQAISGLWSHGEGNESGTYPNYGQQIPCHVRQLAAALNNFPPPPFVTTNPVVFASPLLASALLYSCFY
jgi:hypothetical protein